MIETTSFKYHSDNFSNFCLHDAVISSIVIDEENVDFYFENGLTQIGSEEKTKDALIRIKIKQEDINVYLSTQQKNIFSNTERYKTKSVSLQKITAFLNKVSKIEVVDCLVGILNSNVWRCVSLSTTQKHSYCYFEIQFNPISKIEYEIFYNWFL